MGKTCQHPDSQSDTSQDNDQDKKITEVESRATAAKTTAHMGYPLRQQNTLLDQAGRRPADANHASFSRWGLCTRELVFSSSVDREAGICGSTVGFRARFRNASSAAS